MDGQRRLWQAVTSARRSLNVEKVFIALQKGLLYAVLSITLIYFVTRFFVLPYYGVIGAVVATVAFLLPLCQAFWQRVRQREAMLRLDQFYPHNELVTVLTAKAQSPLVLLLQEKAEMQVGQVLEAFKKRPKQVFQSKVMTAAAGLLVLFLVLTIFPAATQQEAKSIEEDRAITKDLKDKVKEQVEKPVPEETKKELAELQQAIEEAKTSEEALKELVKKQKELTNMEQQLAEEAKNGMTPEMQDALNALGQVNTELAEAASEAQTSLSKLGKPVDLNTQKSIARMNRGDGQQSGDPSEAGGQQKDSDGTATGQNNNSGSSGSNANNQGSTGQNSSNTNAGQQGSGQSGQGGQSSQQGSGNQPGNGQGSSGQGQGAGQGGSGQAGSGGAGGQGGLMGGKGSGGRDLLAIPKRVGESTGPTTDGGLLGDGETVTDRGPVSATKGEVRPYAEVIGTYEDSYMQSTDRLQLPSDLQQMVQNYYSSMEQ